MAGRTFVGPDRCHHHGRCRDDPQRSSTSASEADDGPIQWQFVMMRPWRCRRLEGEFSTRLEPQIVVPEPDWHLAQQIELVEDVGRAIGREERRGAEELKVDMRCG